MREKVLPELDDDFASDASEFETLEELRADIREKVGEALGSRAEEDFRIAAIDAAVDAATVEVPAELVTARATERWERIERQLAQRGMDPNAFLQMQGKTREEVIEESKPDAERELKREAVVTAIAEAEGIEVSDEEMVEALEHSAEHERTTPREAAGAAARERPRRDGRRGHPGPQGDRAGRRVGEADPARAGRGAGADLDAGEGARESRRPLDSGVRRVARACPGTPGASIECGT